MGEELLNTIILTVLASIVLHGITAYPFSVLYSKVLHHQKTEEDKLKMSEYESIEQIVSSAKRLFE